MPHSEANGGVYAVHCSGVVAKALRQLQRRASLQGRGPAVLAAFRGIVQRLRHEPRELGEPLYRLPALRMEVRTVIVGPLAVHFAVCEDVPVVFIKGAELVGGET